MSLSSRCPECGAEVPEGAGLLNLCPRCLLKQALPGESTEASPQPPKKSRTGLPERYGAYRPVGVLGEGGMGIVYLAEQDEPIRRRVALKVIKQGMDTRQVIARFESERQALALMDHPNIAHVYDAGATPEGRPYFAMEYVPGIPITDYCDKYLLGTRERLDLFMKVCAAIQHAHQKGVIHRDIKPSNVLVMIQDGKPVPKVIDFGVAKATSQRLTEKTMFTEFGVLIGTPAYMSPEQAEMTGLDVDTTTDIYSLGVLLYELLVGALPFDAQMLKKAGYDEIRRIIREVEPPRPTVRLHSMGPTATGVARRRQSDVRSLERLLRGDLDWIAMKALEKDRTRRYASASEFAADVLRHLSDEPVQASPPSTMYRTRKFLRKNRRLVITILTVVVLLFVAICATAAYVVQDIFVTIFFPSPPWEGAAKQLVESLHEKGASASEVMDRLRSDPKIEPHVRNAAIKQVAGQLNDRAWYVVGANPLTADDYQDALRQIELAMKADPEDPNHLRTLGVAQYRNGLFHEALESLRRSQELAGDPLNLVFTAMAHFKLGEVAQARAELRTVQDRPKAAAELQARLREAEVLIEGSGKK